MSVSPSRVPTAAAQLDIIRVAPTAATQLDIIENKINQMGYIEAGIYFESLPPEVRNIKRIALAAIQINQHLFRLVGEELRNDKDVVHAAIKLEWNERYVGPALENDEEVVRVRLSIVRHIQSLSSWRTPSIPEAPPTGQRMGYTRT